MHAACMWSRDAEVIMPWEGEAGTGLWHGGGHAAWGQLAVRSLGPAPAGPCCASAPRRASPAPCSDTGPWHRLSTPGLARPRGRAPWKPTQLHHRARPAAALLLLTSPGKTESWRWEHSPPAVLTPAASRPSPGPCSKEPIQRARRRRPGSIAPTAQPRPWGRACPPRAVSARLPALT